jgi:hypothetical protein
LATVLDSSYDLRQVRKRLIKVKDAYLFPTIGIQPDFVLGLDSCVVNEDGVAFLNLDERDVLMEGCLDDGVPLVMLLHQHL